MRQVIQLMRPLLLLALYIGVARADTGKIRKIGPLEMGLVTESMGVAHEKSFWLAWRIRRDNGWHTYWKFPGDVGVPPTVLWDLPAGLQAGELVFPPPRKIMMAQVGAHGHTGETLFLCKFEPKTPFRVGETIRIQGQFSWLTCSQTCLPGYADLSIELKVRKSVSPDPMWKPRFDLFREQQPVAPPKDWEPSASSHSEGYVLSIPSLPGDQPSDVRFFGEGRMIRSNAPQILRRGKQGWELLLTQSPWARKGLTHLSGLLYRREGWGTEENPSFYRLNLPLSKN